MLPAAAPPLVVTTVTLRSAVLHGFPMAVLVGVAELAVVTAGDGTGVDWLGEDSEATCPLEVLWTDPHAAISAALQTRAAAATACRAERADGVMDVPLIVALVPAVGLMLVLRLLDAHVAVLVATSGNRVRAARCFQVIKERTCCLRDRHSRPGLSWRAPSAWWRPRTGSPQPRAWPCWRTAARRSTPPSRPAWCFRLSSRI